MRSNIDFEGIANSLNLFNSRKISGEEIQDWRDKTFNQ
jgi:hypothetical protein